MQDPKGVVFLESVWWLEAFIGKTDAELRNFQVETDGVVSRCSTASRLSASEPLRIALG
jgi:hypothetical protein